MATVLTDIATLATDSAFRTRMKAAVLRTATDVIRDTLDMPDPTEEDKRRRDFAMRVLASGDTYTEQFVWVLATRDEITGSSDDPTLLSWVAAAWNYLAGLPM